VFKNDPESCISDGNKSLYDQNFLITKLVKCLRTCSAAILISFLLLWLSPLKACMKRLAAKDSNKLFFLRKLHSWSSRILVCKYFITD